MNPATFNTLLQDLEVAMGEWDEHPLSNSAKAQAEYACYSLFGKSIEEVFK